MAEIGLTSARPFGLPAPGRFGAPGPTPGVAAQFFGRCVMLLVAARRGEAAAGERLAAACGLAMPEPGKVAQEGGRALLWSGPARWLLLAGPDAMPEDRLRDLLGGTASVVDQSDARIGLWLSGPCARQTLEKCVSIDLHPRAFRTGDTALTLFGHVAVQLWLADDAPRYALLFARSSAASAWRFLEASAAEFGLELRDA